MTTGKDLQLVAGALALGLAALLAGCASTERFDGPGGAERLYRARCSRCHVPWQPSDFLPEEWPAIVEDMGPRAGLGATQRVRVTEYLVSASSAALR